MILSFAQLRSEWIIAGGAPKEADTAAAVAMAESHGNNHAVNLSDPFGGSFCAFQINAVHPFNMHALTQDPYLCALAAKYVRHESGWRAWSTYRYGKYKAFLPHAHHAHGVAHHSARHTTHRQHAQTTHHPKPIKATFSPVEALNHLGICFTLACALFALYRLWLHVFRLWGAAIREEVAVQKLAHRLRVRREEAALRRRTMPRAQRRLALNTVSS